MFDYTVMKMVDCPLCSVIRSSQVVEGAVSDDGKQLGLSEKLGLRRVFSRLALDLEGILGSTVYGELDTDFRSALEKTTTDLLGSLSKGIRPRTSLLFYLGSKADIELLAFLILGSAYKAGLVTHEFVTAFRLRGIRDNREAYVNLVMSDVVVVAYSPSIREDAFLVEDLVRQRAYEGRATYVLLNDGTGVNSVIQKLCSDDGVSARQCLYVGIPQLDKSEEGRVRRVNRAIRNANDLLGLRTPELVLEEEQPTVSTVKKPAKKPRKKSSRAVSTMTASEASVYNL